MTAFGATLDHAVEGDSRKPVLSAASRPGHSAWTGSTSLYPGEVLSIIDNGAMI